MRITAAKNPIDGIKTIKDAENYLASVDKKIKKLAQPTDRLLSVLAHHATAAPKSFTITDKSKTVKVGRTFKPVDKKTLDRIGSSFAQLETLIDQKDELDDFILRARAKFRGVVGNQDLIRSASRIQSNLAAQIAKVRQLLSKLSGHQQPETVRKVTAALSKKLPSVLTYSSASISNYLTSGEKGEPVFWTYFDLKDAVAQDSIYPDYQIVISSSPLSNSVHVTTLRQFAMPGRFPRGLQVEANLGSVMTALQRAFAADGLDSEMRAALPSSAEQAAKKIVHSRIRSVKLSDDYIHIKFKQKAKETKDGGIAPPDAQLVKDLHVALRTALDVPRAAFFSTKPVKYEDGYLGLRVSVVNPKTSLNPSQLEDLKDILNLTDRDMQMLRQMMKMR